MSGRREKTAAKLSPALPQKESRLEYLNRLARGEVDGSSSSDDSDIEDGEQSESDSSSSGDESDGAEHRDPLRVQEEEIGEIEEATHRLAIQNCEWNNLRADDLM